MAEGASFHVDRRARSECRHDGYYSGVGVYAHDAQMLRYVLVCDGCGEEMKEISALQYVPRPMPASSVS